ncbi:hypothetical protein DV515_00016951 [Chloebia gouldiae]|uniref:Dynactin subunit 2 n=2 Tax=Chloebia gouldiae TaxID=44316 RepID=A0A3L8RBR6_CHLGU|nr:hypothetical protein DV515_00016951 [Chloebia gouldiae]
MLEFLVPQARNEPDVYETSDLPEDDQAEFEAEELSSTSVEHLIINPNAAYEKFRDKRLGTEGVDFSDRIGRTRTTGYEAGEYEMLGEGLGAKETPQQRFQRLQHEVQELLRDVEQIQSSVKESGTEEDLTPMALARQVEVLKQQLLSSHLEKVLGPGAAVDFADPEGALAKRLLQQLEVAKCSKATPGKGPARAPAPAGDAVTFELYWRPEQDQFAQSAKVSGGLLAPQGHPGAGHHTWDPALLCGPGTSPQTPQVSELEKRLALLEAAMRCEHDSQVRAQVRGAALPPSCHSPTPVLYLPPPAPLTPFPPTEPTAGGAEGLQSHGESGKGALGEPLSSLPPVLWGAAVPPLTCPPPPLQDTVQVLQAKVNVLDVAVLDQVEARLQSVLGKVNEIAKHKATVQDADTQSKIHQLYETLQSWDAVASALPDVVHRLVTLRDLHEQATQFGQVLVHLDTTQQEIAGALKDNTVLLAEVGPPGPPLSPSPIPTVPHPPSPPSPSPHPHLDPPTGCCL